LQNSGFVCLILAHNSLHINVKKTKVNISCQGTFKLKHSKSPKLTPDR